MKIDELYNTAKKYADQIKQEKPGFVTDDEAALCIIINDKQEIFTGVTGVKMNGSKVETVHAEFNAIMSMKAANQTSAKQMVTVLFKDGSISKPCEACLDLLFLLSNDNNSCAVVVEPEKAESAMSLRFGSSEGSVDMFSGFDDEPAPAKQKLGAPVDYAKGVVDDSNPFNATSDEAQTEVVTFTGDTKKEEKAEESVQSAPAEENKSDGQDAAEAHAEEAAADNADAASEPEEESAPALSKEELLKQAKERKKATKSNWKLFRR